MLKHGRFHQFRTLLGEELQIEAPILTAQNPTALLKHQLKTADQRLNQHFWAKKDVVKLLVQRARLIDEILCYAWQFLELTEHCALLAVGGYGRVTLHPFSDIDLLILHDAPAEREKIEQFISFAWDCGLPIAQSVRSVELSCQYAQKELSVYTNLLNVRYLCGPEALFTQLKEALIPQGHLLWSHERFYETLKQEQKRRHERFDNTQSQIEPNLKEGPGGLRDIQAIFWLARHTFGKVDLIHLLRTHFLTEKEWSILLRGQRFLWEIRYALHSLSKKPNEKLFLEYQEQMVQHFGFKASHINEAISNFMQKFYRYTKGIQQAVNVIFLQYWEKHISNSHHAPYRPINRVCYLDGNYLKISDLVTLSTQMEWVFKLFLIIAQNPKIKGFTAQAHRIIRDIIRLNEDKITPPSKAVLSIFLSLFKQRTGLHRALTLMQDFGLLEIYLPFFERVVGQMQYDLYHVYTVDAHTLLAIRYIERFNSSQEESSFPLCYQIISKVKDIHVLYLGAFFHDMGKGSKGDHSLTGAEIAKNFCITHQMPHAHTEVVCWLVKSHLMMSKVAQTQDITDPKVVKEFAKNVQTAERLNYLYLLTVADICATNPSLWNSWREALIKNLYLATLKWLNQKKLSDFVQAKSFAKTQDHAYKVLQGSNKSAVDRLWETFGEGYFELYEPHNILWHCQLLNEQPQPNPLIGIKPHWNKGGTDILIYSPHRKNLFAAITLVLEKMGLSVVEARLTSSKEICLNTFVVLEASGQPILGPARNHIIKHALTELLKPLIYSKTANARLPTLSKQMPREQKYFKLKADIKVGLTLNQNILELSLVAPDFPGLLSCLGRAFMDCEWELEQAKINTLGNRVEDVFTLKKSQSTEQPNEQTQKKLSDTVKRYLRESLKIRSRL